MKQLEATKWKSPIGELTLVCDGTALKAIHFEDETDDYVQSYWRKRGCLLTYRKQGMTEVKNQLADYFEGKRKRFELELSPEGTSFQKSVWQALTEIDFGETRSYSQVAARIGSPEAVRAVGAANGRNPIPIVIPCHRVIGANGTLTGYAGGLDVKQKLLQLETSSDS